MISKGDGFVLVFDYMLSDLSEIIRNSDKPLTEVSVCTCVCVRVYNYVGMCVYVHMCECMYVCACSSLVEIVILIPSDPFIKKVTIALA